MKAMVLAAGLGTRLRPLTNDLPKALVTLGGRTLLEIALSRLRAFGVRELIVNTHHHADRIFEYLESNHNFGMRIEISHEPVLLDTGGGLKNAAPFFLDSSAGVREPFILHNVDVISTIDLARMIRLHTERHALATLAVQDRETSRYLLFDPHGQLCGRRARRAAKAETPAAENGPAGERKVEAATAMDSSDELVRPALDVQALAFTGIHIISPSIFAKMKDEGAFSIITAYMHLAAQGEKIVAFRADEFYWCDLGRPDDLVQAEHDLSSGKYPSH
jgi:NDP-sugar pyrophosphorylase family protein